MFGAESAQAEKDRLARQSQYAADLRKQIEDKENYRRQAFQSSATNNILQINQNKGNFASRNESWAPSQYMNLQSQTPSFADKERPIGDPYTTTNASTTYQQPTQHPSFGIKQIAEEQTAQQQTSNYASSTYQNNNNNGNLQKIQSQIQSIQNSVDRIISVEIPLRVKPSEEGITTLNSKLESAINNNRETTQAVRDKLAELSFNYNQINQKYLDQNEKLRSSVSELRTEVSRGNESTNARIVAVESRLDTIESSIRSITNKQQQLERAINEQSAILSNSISDVQNNSNNADQTIMNQLETLNKETISTFSQVNQSLQTATMNLNESITNLANDVRDSFKIIRNEHDSDISAVKGQLETATNEIGDSFTALQNEVVTTFNTFKGILKDNITTVQDAIADESKARNEADQILSQNQKELSNGVSSQINILQETIEKVDQNVQPTVDRVCGNYFTQWKNELSMYVNSTLKSIENIQSRLDNSEKKNNDQQLLIDENNKRIVQNEQRIDASDQKDTQLQNRIDDFYKIFVEFKTSSENSDGKLFAEFTKIDQFNTLVSEVNKRFAVDENEITKLKALMNENAQSLKDSIEIFNANSMKFEKKFKKNKGKIALIIDKINQNELDKSNVELMKANIAKLNERFGQSAIDIPVCPRLDRLEEKVSKIKKKIPQNLGNRLGQIEISSANNQLINERIIRLETLLLNWNNKPIFIQPQSLQQGNPHAHLVKRTRHRIRNASKPPTPTIDIKPNPPEPTRPKSHEEKKIVESIDLYDSVSDDSFPIYNNKSSLEICLDLVHIDVEPDNPQHGQFVLLIGEPKKSDRQGLHIFKPKKYDQYIFTDKANFNEQEIRNLINASASNRSRKNQQAIPSPNSNQQQANQVSPSPLNPDQTQQPQFIGPSIIPQQPQPNQPMQYNQQMPIQNMPNNQQMPSQPMQYYQQMPNQPMPYNQQMPNQSMPYNQQMPNQPMQYNQPPFNQSSFPQNQPMTYANLPYIPNQQQPTPTNQQQTVTNLPVDTVPRPTSYPNNDDQKHPHRRHHNKDSHKDDK